MNQKSPADKDQFSASPSQGASKSFAEDTKEGLQGVARELKGEIAHVAKDFAEEAKNAAETRAGVGKDFAADQLGSVADALRRAGRHLRTSESPATEYVERAAASVEGVSHYLQTRTLSQLIGDVERYARREPAIFLGSAFFAGMLGGRFLKAAAPPAQALSAGGNGSRAPSSGEATRTLHASRDDANDAQGSRSKSFALGGDERQDRGNGKMQGQGYDRGASKSVSTGAAEGSSSGKEAQSALKGTASAGSAGASGSDATGNKNNTDNTTNGNKSVETSNRSGKGSGVS